MCGRYTLRRTDHPWIELEGDSDLSFPRYNIAPSQIVPIVGHSASGERVTRFATWGFHPRWYPVNRRSPINARAETVVDKPLFRNAFLKGRCLIPADGWYEWQVQEKGPKQPYFFHLPDDGLFWFAGLAARDSEHQPNFLILTTEATSKAKAVHYRMPVILADDESAATWINMLAEHATLQEMLSPVTDNLIESYPVNHHVNKPENDDPICIEREGYAVSGYAKHD